MNRQSALRTLTLVVLVVGCGIARAEDPVTAESLRSQADELAQRAQQAQAKGHVDLARNLSREAELLLLEAVAVDRGEAADHPHRVQLRQDIEALRKERQDTDTGEGPTEVTHLRPGPVDTRVGAETAESIQELEREISDLKKQGYTPQHPRVRRLQAQLDELRELERVSSLEQPFEEPSPLLPQPEPWSPQPLGPPPVSAEAPEELARRIHHLRLAADNLRAAGMNSDADRLDEQADELDKRMQELLNPTPLTPEERIGELEQAVTTLRSQVEQLKQEVAELRNQLMALRSASN